MNHGSEPGHAPRFTSKQGQYLAFIHAYTLVLCRPPAEADLRRHFRVTPPPVLHAPDLVPRPASALPRDAIWRV
jgi:hypothetical protein